MHATSGQICPACNVEEIRLETLIKDGISPGERFHCAMCNECLTYSATNYVWGKKLFLKVDEASLTSSKEIAIRAIRKEVEKQKKKIESIARELEQHKRVPYSLSQFPRA